MTKPMTEKRAMYAARRYSFHHKVRCIVYKRGTLYMYDPVKPDTRLWTREIIAEYVNGEPVEKSEL